MPSICSQKGLSSLFEDVYFSILIDALYFFMILRLYILRIIIVKCKISKSQYIIFYYVFSLKGSMIPRPRFLQRQIREVPIGTFKHIATIQESASIYDALSLFVERRVSALPVVNERGSLISC